MSAYIGADTDSPNIVQMSVSGLYPNQSDVLGRCPSVSASVSECPSVRVSFFEHLLLAFSVKHKVIASGVFYSFRVLSLLTKNPLLTRCHDGLYSDYILSHPAFSFFILKFFFLFL